MIHWMKQMLDALLSVLLHLLPLSPFADAIDNLTQLPYLAQLPLKMPEKLYPRLYIPLLQR